jgi:glycine/D-amino acid oxidase-like deaminating enzyme
MPRSAAASAACVIVGGGVVGASAAFHLAEAGARSCCVERGAARQRLDLEGGGRRARAVLATR